MPHLQDLRLGAREFAFLASLIKQQTGIVLADNKREMLQARLAKRVRQLDLQSFEDYCALLTGPQGDAELRHTLNAVTTNLTRFFREGHHFEHLAEVALPELIERRAQGRRLRLWSAGCASGEEAYSIGMVLQDAVPNIERWDARILATDIDTEMIGRGKAGRYDTAQTELVPPSYSRFLRRAADQPHRVEVSDAIKRLIAFKPLNLLGPWPMKGPFDVIFCRNVVIYFDRETQMRLFQRFAEMLADDGYLYIGHSESLYGLNTRFKLIGRTIHVKAPAGAAASG
jgi:chemotaxis protein methyltransferase CheR